MMSSIFSKFTRFFDQQKTPDIPKVAMKDELCEKAISIYEAKFGSHPLVVATAPGRVNLIGEHTDYQEGYVFPAALDRKTVICLSLNDSGKYHLVSDDLKKEEVFEEIPTAPTDKVDWYSYIIGTIRVFCEVSGTDFPKGFNLLCLTSVPIGAGLSSSAALEVAVATAMEGATGKELSPLVKARDVCQKAEHLWAKMPCGLMDQAIAVMGKQGQAMLFDCKTQKALFAPIPSDVAILIVNSGVSHTLVAGHYANRREACQNAVDAIKKKHPEIHSLRDVSSKMLEDSHSDFEDELSFARATHVVNENVRSEEFSAALQAGDLKKAGEIMYAGHTSLHEYYDVTVPETDKIVEIAKTIDGVFGARMTGGGFGGSVCILVDVGKAESILQSIMKEYVAYFESNKKEEDEVVRHDPVAFVAVPSMGAAIYNFKA